MIARTTESGGNARGADFGAWASATGEKTAESVSRAATTSGRWRQACGDACGRLGGTDLQLQRRRHAIAHHERIRGLVLPVLMKVDEAGGNDVVRCIDHAGAVERRCGDRLHSAGANPDMPDGVEPGFGIHHPAVGDHEVEGRLAAAGGEEDSRNEYADGTRIMVTGCV